MVTDNSTNNKFAVAFQGDYASPTKWIGYTGSRSMLRVERQDQQKVTVVTILCQPNPNKNISCYTDPNGVLEIPLRNILALNQGITPPTMSLDISMTEIDGTAVDTFGKYIDVCKGLSYNDALAPTEKDSPMLASSNWHYCILPPNVIINPDNFSGVAGFGVIVESNYHDLDANTVWASVVGGLANTITPSGDRGDELVIPYAADTLRITAGKDLDKIKNWPLEKPSDCTDLVCIRWTSQTGAVRQHYFPIASWIKGSDKQVSLISAGDGYLVDKNRYYAVRCRLTGLTQYGYWYYMDLLHASDAHAIIQPTFSLFDDEMESEQSAAYIEATEMETPQGVGFYDFEFVLKLRHYGTL